MRLVKKILIGAGLFLLAALAVNQNESPEAGPTAPQPHAGPQFPARADLAEAVYAMVLENAAQAGVPLSQPPSLCQACAAAHLGLPAEVARQQCVRACGLR